MKPLVIYYADCADGFGAAFAAWLKLGNDAEYLPMSYGDASPDVLAEKCHGREVYILAFSFKRLVMEHIFQSAKRVVWLDDHKTAFEMWCGAARPIRDGRYEPTTTAYGYDNYVLLDNNKSGAMLAWEYFHPGSGVPESIKHIDDYDRRQFKIEGSKAFNKALWSHAPWSFEQWCRLLGEVDELISEGEAVLRAHNQNVQAVVGDASRSCEIFAAESGAYRGFAANCPPHLTSDVGHELATQSGTYGLCWYLPKGGSKVHCSLRSNGNYDVSRIAEAFGGGGHRNAAGFEVEIEVLLGWLI